MDVPATLRGKLLRGSSASIEPCMCRATGRRGTFGVQAVVGNPDVSRGCRSGNFHCTTTGSAPTAPPLPLLSLGLSVARWFTSCHRLVWSKARALTLSDADSCCSNRRMAVPVLMLAVSALVLLQSAQGAQRSPVNSPNLLPALSARHSGVHGAGAVDFAPAPAPSASNTAETAFLYIIQAANATLSVPNARTPYRGNLRMTGVDNTSVWFSNKPVRRAGRVMTDALAGPDYYRINGALADLAAFRSSRPRARADRACRCAQAWRAPGWTVQTPRCTPAAPRVNAWR